MRAVRAGEAKLRGRMTSDVPIAGPPGCWDRRGVSGFRAVFRTVFADSFIKMEGFWSFLSGRARFLLLFTWVLRNCLFFRSTVQHLVSMTFKN